jgi:hypothetical protein
MHDDQGPILPESDAEPIELEPRPRVVRLNRRAIFVAGGLATAVLLAAVFTLSERSQRTAARRDQQSGVSAAPDRFWEGQPDGVPRLPVPPPLPEPVSPAEGSEAPVLDGGASPQLLEPTRRFVAPMRRARSSTKVASRRARRPRNPRVRQPLPRAPPIRRARATQPGIWPVSGSAKKIP